MHRRVVILLGVVLAAAVAIGDQGTARAALQKPAYTAGDRWVYDLHGSLEGFPGSNASAMGNFTLGLAGRTEVVILGTDQVLIGGVSTAVVRVETRTSGFLNGTFSAPGLPGTAEVAGTFSSLTTELWETRAYLPVASDGTTTYSGSVSLIIAIDFSTTIRFHATTTYASVPAFELGVGESATTAFTTDAFANSTSTFAGQTFWSENTTRLTGTWARDVVRETNVSVDAGTFAATQIDQTITAFPGLAGLVPAEGSNETAYHSNSAGNYVRRDAYANGTRVAEMTLQSYAYPSRPAGLSILDLSLLIALPIVALLAIVVWLRRRRKKPTVPEGEADAR